MNSYLKLTALFFSLMLPIAASSIELEGRSHATAMLLLSDSDQSVKLAGKSIFWLGSGDRELLDVVGEVMWNVCSGKQKMDDDSLSWLVEAMGRARQPRYIELLDYCISMPIDAGAKSRMKKVREAFTYKSTDIFLGDHMDLPKIRAGLIHTPLGTPAQLSERFNGLHTNMTLGEVYSLLGYPDEVGFSSTSQKNKANPKVRVTALVIKYKEIGTIHFYAENDQHDWLIDNAMSVKGLMLSSYDGQFASTRNLLTHGNASQLDEIADYLLAKNSLDSTEYDAIVERSTMPVDPQDSGIENSIALLGKVIFQGGNKEIEKNFVLHQIKHGNGLQLRYVAELILDNNYLEKEVLDTVMQTISNSRDTKDAKYADGLAWLCKVILRSGSIKYKEAMEEVAKMAESQKLQKYAGQAAAALH